MPNLDQIRKSQERRAAREQKVSDNKQASIDQEATLTELQGRLQRAKAGQSTPEDDEAEAEAAAKRPKRAAVGREAKLAKQLEAEKQAEIDAQNTIAPVTDEPIDLSQWTRHGLDVPLHILNKLAQQADRAVRDEARAVAQAVGKSAFDIMTDRRSPNTRDSRQRTVAETASAMARQNAINAAKAKTDTE